MEKFKNIFQSDQQQQQSTEETSIVDDVIRLLEGTFRFDDC